MEKLRIRSILLREADLGAAYSLGSHVGRRTQDVLRMFVVSEWCCRKQESKKARKRGLGCSIQARCATNMTFNIRSENCSVLGVRGVRETSSNLVQWKFGRTS